MINSCTWSDFLKRLYKILVDIPDSVVLGLVSGVFGVLRIDNRILCRNKIAHISYLRCFVFLVFCDFLLYYMTVTYFYLIV